MHVGIIMDGNGRWATARGLLRSSGHRAGAEVVRRIVEAAAEEKVDVLTLYAFSSDNWQRPRTEVAAVMALLKRHLATELPKCLEHGIRLNVIGRRSRLDRALLRAIDHAERTTAGGRGMLLRLAVDYSARQAIAEAALSTDRGDEPFEQRLAAVTHSAICPMDLDLLIRTGGERRLSDFLLWESAYAELVFSDTLWPDYTADELRAALAEFACRERRFGGIAPSVAPARMDGVVADPRADLQRQAVH